MPTLDSHLASLLTRTAACDSCGGAVPAHAPRCATCDASLEASEVEVSVLSAPEQPATLPTHGLTPEQQRLVEQLRTKVPLEKGENYLLFRHTFQGACDGSLAPASYRTAVHKLITIGDTGVKVLEHALVTKKIARVSAEARAVQQAMLDGFYQLRAGAQQMETWLTSQAWSDLVEGAQHVEEGYQAIDRAQDAALALE